MEVGKVSSSFRKQLKRTIPLWQEQGLLTEQQGVQLGEYYRLDHVKTESTQLLLSIIYTVGAVLIGVGVISFVAAHWNHINRPIKVTLLFATMLSAHGLGYHLWFINGKYPRLGHALIFLGTLIFGANVGLMAQVFHISGGSGRMFGVWAIGAAAVAYAVRSIPNATVAVVMAFLFFIGFSGIWDGPDRVVFWYPFVAALVLVPLVYLCNSRWLLWLVMVNLSITSPVIFGEQVGLWGAYMISIGLGAAFLGWGIFNSRSRSFQHFSRHCMNAGAALVLLFLYLLSFGDCARELEMNLRHLFYDNRVILSMGLGYLISAAAFYAISIYVNYKRMDDVLTVLLLGIGGFAAGIVGLVAGQVGTMILTNVLLIAIAFSLIRASFSEEDRRKFWCGAVVLGAVIVGRTLEFETGLLIKAIAFTGSGVGVIIGGVLFENFMKKKKVIHA